MVAPAMADQAMADQAIVDSEKATADLSVEQAFFEPALLPSDRPVWFDTERPEPLLDLEPRELRRAHFTRVVGAIIATLGIGTLLALVRLGPSAAEAAPLVAAHLVTQEMPEMQLIEPSPAAPPLAPSVSVAPAPRVSAGVVKVKRAP